MSEISLISKPRLATYKKFSADDKKAVELHNMTMQVGSSLMAVIALIELGVRNRVNDQLAQDFREQEWMLNPPTAIVFHGKEARSIKSAKSHAQKAEYSKLSHKKKKALDTKIYPRGVPSNIKHETLSKKRQETFSVSQGQLIAQSTLFFWKRLFSSDYNVMLWKPSLKKVFPQKHIKRTDVSRHLETLYSARNRVAHHEPIYGAKLDQAFEAVSYVRENFNRRKNDTETELMLFTEIQFHRLYIDYISFKRSWSLLED